jgi:hypothetical protein
MNSWVEVVVEQAVVDALSALHVVWAASVVPSRVVSGVVAVLVPRGPAVVPVVVPCEPIALSGFTRRGPSGPRLFFGQ